MEEDYEIHPAEEIILFMDWVDTCFAWHNTSATQEDLFYIRQTWYPGKAPIDAVKQCMEMRRNEHHKAISA